jgi:hypothetical protein
MEALEELEMSIKLSKLRLKDGDIVVVETMDIPSDEFIAQMDEVINFLYPSPINIGVIANAKKAEILSEKDLNKLGYFRKEKEGVNEL